MEKLGILAFKFRGTKDAKERDSIAQEYADIVKRLIASGNWKESPPFEDMLPDKYMPKEFWEYWSTK